MTDKCPFCGAIGQTKPTKSVLGDSVPQQLCGTFLPHLRSIKCYEAELAKLRTVAEWALKFLACGINSDFEEVDQELLIYCIEGMQESLRDAGYLPLTPPAEVGNEIAPE